MTELGHFEIILGFRKPLPPIVFMINSANNAFGRCSPDCNMTFQCTSTFYAMLFVFKFIRKKKVYFVLNENV